jgi:hypothetical protein
MDDVVVRLPISRSRRRAPQHAVHPSSVTYKDDDDLHSLVLAGCGNIGSSKTPPPSSSTKYGGAENYFGRLCLNHVKLWSSGRERWKWSKRCEGREEGISFYRRGGQPPRGGRRPCPLPVLHSCGWTLHSHFLKPTQAILISTQEIP